MVETGRIRTSEVGDERFTGALLWPLAYISMKLLQPIPPRFVTTRFDNRFVLFVFQELDDFLTRLLALTFLKVPTKPDTGIVACPVRVGLTVITQPLPNSFFLRHWTVFVPPIVLTILPAAMVLILGIVPIDLATFPTPATALGVFVVLTSIRPAHLCSPREIYTSGSR